MERQRLLDQDPGSNIEWIRSFEKLGVEAKFLSFWNKATAFKFGIDPSIFIDVWPVKPELHLDRDFMYELAGELLKEITDKVLVKGEKRKYELVLRVDMYNEDDQTLGFEAYEDDEIPPSINALPL